MYLILYYLHDYISWYNRPGFLEYTCSSLDKARWDIYFSKGLIWCKTKKNTFSSTWLNDPSSQTLINCSFYSHSWLAYKIRYFTANYYSSQYNKWNTRFSRVLLSMLQRTLKSGLITVNKPLIIDCGCQKHDIQNQNKAKWIWLVSSDPSF